MTTIITKHGTGIPSSLAVGELAIDKSEPAIYTNTGSSVEKIAGASSGAGGGGGLLQSFSDASGTYFDITGTAPVVSGGFKEYWPNASYDQLGIQSLGGGAWNAIGQTITISPPSGLRWSLNLSANQSNYNSATDAKREKLDSFISMRAGSILGDNHTCDIILEDLNGTGKDLTCRGYLRLGNDSEFVPIMPYQATNAMVFGIPYGVSTPVHCAAITLYRSEAVRSGGSGNLDANRTFMVLKNVGYVE